MFWTRSFKRHTSVWGLARNHLSYTSVVMREALCLYPLASIFTFSLSVFLRHHFHFTCYFSVTYASLCTCSSLPCNRGAVLQCCRLLIFLFILVFSYFLLGSRTHSWIGQTSVSVFPHDPYVKFCHAHYHNAFFTLCVIMHKGSFPKSKQWCKPGQIAKVHQDWVSVWVHAAIGCLVRQECECLFSSQGVRWLRLQYCRSSDTGQIPAPGPCFDYLKMNKFYDRNSNQESMISESGSEELRRAARRQKIEGRSSGRAPSQGFSKGNCESKLNFFLLLQD